MSKKENIQLKIDELIDSASSMDRVNTPPFFKDKVLSGFAKIATENQESFSIIWFTPKHQIAALLIFAFINLSALYLYNNYNQSQDIETFAQAYGFSPTDNQSILN